MPTVEELKALAIEEIDKRKEEIIGHAKHILNNPEVGFTELFKLFLDVLAIKLTKVFSAGHEPSFGVNPIQIISVKFPLTVVGVLSP